MDRPKSEYEESAKTLFQWQFVVCNLHSAALELRLSTVSAENAGSYSALQGMTSSIFIQTSFNRFFRIRLF